MDGELWQLVVKWFREGVVEENLMVAQRIPRVLDLALFEDARESYRQYVLSGLNAVEAALFEVMFYLRGREVIDDTVVDAEFVCELANLVIIKGSNLMADDLERRWRFYDCCSVLAPLDSTACAKALRWVQDGFGSPESLGDPDLLHVWDTFPQPSVLTAKDLVALQTAFEELVEFRCFCGLRNAEAMVQCDSGILCVGEQWYHEKCVHYIQGDFECEECSARSVAVRAGTSREREGHNDDSDL